MLLFRQIKFPIINLGKCLNSNVPNLWSGWKKAGKKPIDKESLYKEIQKGVKHKPKSGWEEFYLINGTFAKRRVPWSMGTLRYDHGKDFIASVPKYDGFCTVPSHVDYKRNIGSFLNLYEPITHIPQKGKFPHIQELILHIFGEHYELGMDYFQFLYLNPVQKLPILLLVSQERNTGKSTFLNFLKAIFQDNVTFNTNEDFFVASSTLIGPANYSLELTKCCLTVERILND